MKGISIIIPTYNRAELLKEAIISVLNQEIQDPLEIIVSDDGSTDGTLEMASSFGRKVRVLPKPEECITQGAGATRNRGIQACKYDYICFLDSDDFYLPGHLQKMQEAIESETDLGFALCNSLEMYEDDLEFKYRRWTKTNIQQKDIENLAISSFHFANTNGFIFKKEVFQKVGLFNENYRNAEDTDVWLRISENFKGTHANHYGTIIRIHNLHRLTDVPKQSLLQNHYIVFRSAIRRYKQKGLKDKYRLRKLYVLCIKYKLSQWPGFKEIYKIISKQNSKSSLSPEVNSSWKSLEHFFNPNQNFSS